MPQHTFLVSHYDPYYIVLSITIAVLAGYLALELIRQVTSSVGVSRLLWIVGGAFTMGTGVWAMHCIGLLVVLLAIPVSSDLPFVVMAFFAVIAACSVALHFVSQPTLDSRGMCIGSCVVGLGISVIRDTGIAAMRLQTSLFYEAWLTLCSYIIAVVVSFVGLRIAFTQCAETLSSGHYKKCWWNHDHRRGHSFHAVHWDGRKQYSSSGDDRVFF